jgi:hypothetical protein
MISKTLAQDYLTESIYSLDLKQKDFIYEISVPTCSYRMGVERIGYVVLLLDSGMVLGGKNILLKIKILIYLERKTAHLTILSTPRRYLSFYLYIVYGILGIIFLILTSLFSRRTLMQLFKLRRLTQIFFCISIFD